LLIQVERPGASLPWEFYVTQQLAHRLQTEQLAALPAAAITGSSSTAAASVAAAAAAEVVVIRPTQLFRYKDGYAMPMCLGRCGTLHDLVVSSSVLLS
jgi:hypothetical protein